MNSNCKFLIKLTFCLICFQSPIFSYCQSFSIFHSQSDVDSFPIKFPNQKVVGNVLIGFTEAMVGESDIHDLTPLSSIEKIQGDLYIHANPCLKSLYGLHNVDTIQAVFWARIVGNDSLINLDGLSSLKYVNELDIEENPLLEDLDGLNNLIEADGIGIVRNENLTSINGLSNLQIVNSGFSIWRNNLEDIFLPKLKKVGSLSISSEPKLKNINGLSNLDSIGFCNTCTFGFRPNIGIGGNDSLKNFDGLNDVVIDQDGWIIISKNESLENMTSFSTWQLDSINFLKIEENPNLKGSISSPYLRSAGKEIHIIENSQLDSVYFPNLTKIGVIRDGRESIAPDNQLIIDDNEQLTFIALPKLSTMKGSVSIQGNPNLNHFDLEVLKRVEGHLFISALESLENLQGINNLQKVDFRFSLQNGSGLVSLNGLENLEYIGEKLVLGGFSNLENIESIYNIDSIGWEIVDTLYSSESGGITVNETQKLTTVDFSNSQVVFPPRTAIEFIGNENLESVYIPILDTLSSINFRENQSLETIDFINLVHIGSFYSRNLFFTRTTINGNNNLKSIDFLHQLRSILSTRDLIISNNPVLNDCDAVCSMLDNGIAESKLEIENNSAPCNTLAQILENVCTTVSTTELESSENVSPILVSPNPNDGVFNLLLPESITEASVTFYNLGGKEVFQKRTINNQKIDISHLQNGLYLFKVRDVESGHLFSGKFLIAK